MRRFRAAFLLRYHHGSIRAEGKEVLHMTLFENDLNAGHIEETCRLWHADDDVIEIDLPARPRRLRRTEEIRAMVREYSLHAESLIYPIFVSEYEGEKHPVESMPGIFRHTLQSLSAHLAEVHESGVRSVLFFGIPDEKDELATHALHDQGIVQKAVALTKSLFPDMAVHADICLCGYTTHGQCGVMRGSEVDNDSTLPLLGEMAVSCAVAGADGLAPSGMLDGSVGYIRRALDKAGFSERLILAYSLKYTSAFCRPFDEAAGITPLPDERKSCQMDFANKRDGMREADLAVREGADILVVKPASSYLDLVSAIHDKTCIPVAAYQASGEYAMIKAAASAGFINEKDAVLETLTCMRRAGAQLLITYFAPQAARWIRASDGYSS